jgi:hypothetical protein
MSEHFHSPEELTPEEAQLPSGVHEIPDAEASEGSYTREVLQQRIEHRLAELSPETLAAKSAVETLYEQIQSYQGNDSVADILDDAHHIYQEFADTVTAFTSGNGDEEEIQISAHKTLDALSTIQSMIRHDRDVPPTE